MRGMASWVTGLMVVIAGCSSSGSPATTPSAVPAPTTTLAVTTTTLPPTTTTTTTQATTTTVDRLAEIEAIFQDLEERRLQALYEGDRETFRTLFANKEYLQRSLGVLDLVEFVAPPDEVVVNLVVVKSDTGDCIAAQVFTDATRALGPDGLSDRTIVLELVDDQWGFSYIGEGWACDGPHPLSP